MEAYLGPLRTPISSFCLTSFNNDETHAKLTKLARLTTLTNWAKLILFYKFLRQKNYEFDKAVKFYETNKFDNTVKFSPW